MTASDPSLSLSLPDVPEPWVEVVDKPIRSAIKAVSYRIFGSCATAGISYFFTHSKTAALSIGAVEFCSKFVLFYVHERAWIKVRLGQERVYRDYEI